MIPSTPHTITKHLHLHLSCEFTFMLRKFIEPARSCFLQPCQVCSPVRVFLYALQVRRACSLVFLATLPGLLTRASLFSCFVSSLSLLARASCNLVGSAHPYEFIFMLLRRACSLVLLATLSGLLTRASLLSCFVSSPSLLARASCNLTGSAHPWEFTFMLRKFTDPARSSFLQPFRVCSPVRVYFHTSQVCRACSLAPLATFPGLLTRASLLSCFASSPSFFARASCNLAGSAHPCKFTFMLHKFAKPARSCFLQHCWVCSPVRIYFHASQVRRACSLAPVSTLFWPPN
ncbi:hypothetical protein CRG98_012171 [Punica granatum]|uniref:Uncharacterized protein n=1 Tax=Punica granatum TaxID=22663 RepID=A0A2I0KG15_PUNGR|nr:hypothetical protein CRG98_012171 [Punica granatum]